MKELIENFKPINKQETRDKEVILEYLSYFDNLLTRENNFAHFTSSAFIVNQDYTKVLMAYHNIYKSYAWLGGHMDGATNPLKVAIKEAKEESSISKLELITTDIISLDAIEVTGHIKKNNWVTPHIHLNVTYLFKANDEDFIHENLDENKEAAYKIVGSFETDPFNGKISNECPLAKAIIGHGINEIVSVGVAKPYEVRIKAISYEA